MACAYSFSQSKHNRAYRDNADYDEGAFNKIN